MVVLNGSLMSIRLTFDQNTPEGGLGSWPQIVAFRKESDQAATTLNENLRGDMPRPKWSRRLPSNMFRPLSSLHSPVTFLPPAGASNTKSAADIAISTIIESE